MIGRLRGTLVHKQPPWLMIDVGGVGYELEAPMSTFYDLPEVGREVTLFTHHAVKDAMEKGGFPPAQAAVTMRADNDVAVAGETAEQVVKMLDLLDDLDDVQHVWHNAELPQEAYQ